MEQALHRARHAARRARVARAARRRASRRDSRRRRRRRVVAALVHVGPGARSTTAQWLDAALDMRERLGAMPFVVRDNASGDDRRQHALFQCRCRQPAARDRPHVVREARAAHGDQHRMQAAAPDACVRDAELHRRRVPHALVQPGSRAAIARLGAKQDGMLRNHQLLPDGSRRDTVVFSIIDGEWPAVKGTCDSCSIVRAEPSSRGWLTARNAIPDSRRIRTRPRRAATPAMQRHSWVAAHTTRCDSAPRTP